MDPRLTPLAASLPASVPFTGPETLERRCGARFAARLGANESPFGPSPLALAAMRRAAEDAWMYGDPETHDLRHALAARLGVPPVNVALGEGIDGLLGLLARLLVEPGTPVVTSQGGYPTFDFHARGFGGVIHAAPYRYGMSDPDALLALARGTGARLIYLSNPDNPLGGFHDAATIERMVEGVPEGALLLLDEAYGEFAPPLPRIDPEDPRVVRLRTFSKAHGLAGLRVGYAVGPAALLGALDRVRNHFGIGRIAQTAALAAVEDATWAGEVRSRVERARARIATIARAAGLAPLPSHANFVAIDCGDAERARGILDGLVARGVFVRKPGVPPLDRCVRITAGTDADLDVLARALPETV